MGLHSLNGRSLDAGVCVSVGAQECVCVSGERERACMCARARRCCGSGVSLDGVTLLSPFRLVADADTAPSRLDWC